MIKYFSFVKCKDHCPHLKDISEGVAGQIAEVGVADQTLHQRLLERFSGTSPQLLSTAPFGHTMSAHIFTGRPTAKSQCEQISEVAPPGSLIALCNI